MLNLLKEEINKATIFTDESKFNLNYIPKRLLHREDEFRQLSRLFLPLIKLDSSKSNNIILIGNYGSGKTALSMRFGRSFEEIASDFEKHVKYIHINCRLVKSNYAIMKKIIKKFNRDFPEKGFSLYELVNTLKLILEENDVILILTLDEVNFLDFKNDNLIYILNRINDDDIKRDNRISIIGIERNLNFIQNLDLSTLSSFQYNLIKLKPYNEEEIYDILKFRASIALKKSSYTAEILRYISRVGSKNADMRYSLELLYKSGKYADQKGYNVINAECVRYAQASTFENFELSSLKNLSRNELIILKAITRSLRREKVSSIDINSIKEMYNVICEELNENHVKKSQFYLIINNLEKLDLISKNKPFSKKLGQKSRISIDCAPIEFIEDEIRKIWEVV
jgi:cell division control protein 6